MRRHKRRQCLAYSAPLESDERGPCCQDCAPLYAAACSDREYVKAIKRQSESYKVARRRRIARHAERVALYGGAQ